MYLYISSIAPGTYLMGMLAIYYCLKHDKKVYNMYNYMQSTFERYTCHIMIFFLVFKYGVFGKMIRKKQTQLRRRRTAAISKINGVNIFTAINEMVVTKDQSNINNFNDFFLLSKQHHLKFIKHKPNNRNKPPLLSSPYSSDEQCPYS